MISFNIRWKFDRHVGRESWEINGGMPSSADPSTTGAISPTLFGKVEIPGVDKEEEDNDERAEEGGALVEFGEEA